MTAVAPKRVPGLPMSSGLSNEVKEVLERHKPQSFGEAKNLPGMTPAAASILLSYVKK